MKILAIGDTQDNILTYQKFSDKIKIHLINFPKKQVTKFTEIQDGFEYFDSLLLSKQVEKINKIKDNYDLCIVVGWAAARVAYFSGLNYLMYFVGNDITTPPFEKSPKVEYLNEPIFERNLIERYFYKKIFNSAIGHMTGSAEYSKHLIKYDKNGIRLDNVIVDVEIFNENIMPKKLNKNKFTFFAPQRLGLEKGYDIIWKALKICKSDFEILQVKWFDERTEEEKKIKEKLLKEKPKQIKFIELIKREEIASYYNFADAILGQMRVGVQGGIEREAALCKKPVICYTDPEKTTIINNIEIIPPFLPKTKEPSELAELIDNIVDSETFRKQIAHDEYEFVNKLSNPKNVIKEWEKIFFNLKILNPTIHRKEKIFFKIFKKFTYEIFEKYYFKKFKNKNIEAFGEIEYNQLTKK